MMGDNPVPGIGEKNGKLFEMCQGKSHFFAELNPSPKKTKIPPRGRR
jgi:hypothetical protein